MRKIVSNLSSLPNLGSLPVELVLEVAYLLGPDPISITSFAATCKTHNAQMKDATIWKKLFSQTFCTPSQPLNWQEEYKKYWVLYQKAIKEQNFEWIGQNCRLLLNTTKAFINQPNASEETLLERAVILVELSVEGPTLSLNKSVDLIGIV